MYNLYVYLCGLILSIILLILYKNKSKNIKMENKYYLIMIINTIIMSIVSMIAIYLNNINYNQMFLEILTKIDYFLIFNYSINFFMYVLGSGNLMYNKINIFYCILNAIAFVLILILPLEFKNLSNFNYHIEISPLLIITILFSIIMMLFLVDVEFKNKDKIKDNMNSIIFLIVYIILIFILRLLIPEFLIFEFLLTIAILIIYIIMENPDLKKINELNAAKYEADKSNKAKTEFLSSMSHEIRTPLNAIVGFNQCISEAKSLEEAKENSKDVLVATDILLDIINGILDISKIESGKLELTDVKYQPRKFFDDVVKLLEPKIKQKDLEFNFKISENLPYRLCGDQFNLKKCVINILTNAVKYTDSGTINLFVNCINENDECKMSISVEDTGRGIKEEDLSKVFTKFHRLEEYRNSSIEGTGLGLAITKQIIELMGGKITVQSVYEKGSKFTIFVTQKIVNMTKSVESSNNNVNSTNELLIFKDKKVLLVDDNSLNLKVASRLLEKYEVIVDTVTSGSDCIEKLKNIKYDLILMDDMMPKMTGRETLVKLKEEKDFDIPVVVLTANSLVGEREKYIKEGFSEYLSKPINREELEKILKHFLGNNKKKPINFDDTQTMRLDFSSLKN